MRSYAPSRGDVVWLNFSPQAGHEQAGRRPALVISPGAYNRRTGLALCCPVTSQVKGYPFEVALDGKTIRGVVLCDQLRCLDWRERQAGFIETAPTELLDEVTAKLLPLIQDDGA